MYIYIFIYIYTPAYLISFIHGFKELMKFPREIIDWMKGYFKKRQA